MYSYATKRAAIAACRARIGRLAHEINVGHGSMYVVTEDGNRIDGYRFSSDDNYRIRRVEREMLAL